MASLIEKQLGPPPADTRCIFIDMDSFFATAEQQRNPALRGKPVAVCPFVHDSTCVIAASIEAKKYGVKTGTPIPVARQLCPNLIFMGDDPTWYRQCHVRIMDALRSTSCRVKVKSIDEAVLHVPSYDQHRTLEIARQIKVDIRAVGDYMSCSAGIASNQFLAKLACNLRKPDGLLQIHNDDLESVYSLLSLTDLTGISWRMERRLNAIGITTALEFYQASHHLLKTTFGIPGEMWYLRLRGYEVDQKPTTRGMVGHQTTIAPQPAATKAHLLSVASQLAYKAAARLRRSELSAQTVSISLRDTARGKWHKRIRTHSPFSDSTTLYEHVEKLLENWQPRQPIRRISVVTTDLVPWSAQPQPLFAPPGRNTALSTALDTLDERYGRYTVRPARHMLTRQVSDRVGFGNVPHNLAPTPAEQRRARTQLASEPQ